jgi:nitronate monooxygenase
MTAWPDDRLIRLLGIAHPIIQAPMVGATSTDLMIGAMEGGALGSLPCGTMAADEVRDAVRVVRQKIGGPINLNFFCHVLSADADDASWRAALKPFYAEHGIEPGGPPPPLRAPFGEEMCALVEELRPEVVSFHYGLPETGLLARVRASGAAILSSATTVPEARLLERMGCDAIIAQGSEAGGHRGWFDTDAVETQIGTFALVPQVVDAVDLPIIAAGGIADSRGIAAALALGAAGVQIGTAYLFADEAPISAAYRAALQSERARRTVLTNAFSGGLARGIPNRLTDAVGAITALVPPFPHASTALAPLRKSSEARGEDGFTPLWAGQAAPLGRRRPAREITGDLARGTLALLGRLGSA